MSTPIKFYFLLNKSYIYRIKMSQIRLIQLGKQQLVFTGHMARAGKSTKQRYCRRCTVWSTWRWFRQKSLLRCSTKQPIIWRLFCRWDPLSCRIITQMDAFFAHKHLSRTLTSVFVLANSSVWSPMVIHVCLNYAHHDLPDWRRPDDP